MNQYKNRPLRPVSVSNSELALAQRDCYEHILAYGSRWPEGYCTFGTCALMTRNAQVEDTVVRYPGVSLAPSAFLARTLREKFQTSPASTPIAPGSCHAGTETIGPVTTPVTEGSVRASRSNR